MLHAIIGGICRSTDKPRIEFDHEDNRFYIQVTDEDQGRAIGKKGKTIWAITTLVWYAGVSNCKQLIGIVLDDPVDTGKVKPSVAFKANRNWDRKIITNLTEIILSTVMKERVVPWAMEERGLTDAIVRVQMDRYLQTPMIDPSFEEAFTTVIHSCGMAGGASINTEFEWK